ncbi:dihydrofolate reductase family protein [Paracoccus versutus]|uniref:Riboflavin biosynthesis pyrimidine reductase n=1 Tax=Paracoccus versutus TaxID=34007 RepID=A0A3D9XS99_PARVE|nr:RibD family protein [Paracoccus versutus]REF73275.1 riboflavin biosynthesis pyrimidine reductase [Paracoccus versutus]WGR54697.1 RibD family protein [Paracoccus versutus]
MTRPRVFIHTHMSLDGKIVGAYLPTEVGVASQRQYYELVLGPDRAFDRHKGWLCGRVSSDDNFTHYRTPDLDEAASPVPDGDFITVADAPMYYFSVDPSGVLAWETNSITYFETTAHVVEILSGRASNAYKDFLRRKGVSYIVAGGNQLDLEEAVRKIGEIFGVQEIMLGGGGSLNWSFIRAGLCDEVSIVMTPAADGTKGAQTLFEANERYATPLPTAFKLKGMKPLADGSIWLRYDVIGPIPKAGG